MRGIWAGLRQSIVALALLFNDGNGAMLKVLMEKAAVSTVKCYSSLRVGGVSLRKAAI